MPARGILCLHAGLHQETAVRNFHRYFLTVSCPDIEAGIPGFSMYGKSVEVLMKAGTYGIQLQETRGKEGDGERGD